MSKAPIIAGIAAALVIGAAIAAFAIVWRPAISPIEPPVPQAFKPELVKRGRELAAIGNCNNCHTLRGGKAFAGGLGVPTPFGSVYSSNITPDPDTGIGRWSEEAFRRAMHSGVDRAGRHLYPTFPYDHFTNVTDEDDHALYAFLMTRQPVHAPARANDLAFPLNQRFVVAGWKLLFFRRGTYQAEPAQSADWNRGAYLVEGLAHCGACHTPRNALGAEEVSASFSGGDVDNWHAYAINARSPSPVPWTGQALARYLRRGFDPDHGVARGPMAEVVSNLSSADESDVQAIAVYMASVFGSPSGDRVRNADAVKTRTNSPATQAASATQADPTGAVIYAAACAMCHETERPLPYGGVDLALSTALSAPDPRNATNIILAGIPPVAGERSPIMPGFAASMTDDEAADLLAFLRARFSTQPAWQGIEHTVADARRMQTVFLETSPGPHNAPAEPTQRDKP